MIGWSLAHFPTCGDEAASLQVEMAEAQKELRARGILTKEEVGGIDDGCLDVKPRAPP